LPPGRTRPTTYYGPDTGVGIVLREAFPAPRNVGLVGLGVGTLAAYGQTGDTFTFYEINRQVIDIAQALFFYLRESHARIHIVEGDARLSLERDTSPPFDVLALDAFSGDAIPVHLITQEALAIYKRHLKTNGVIAFHVSNGFLDLAPIVQQLANESGFSSVLVRSHQNIEDLLLPADWVLVTNNPAVLENPTIKTLALPIGTRRGVRPWTDDYNNLLQILRTPHIQLR
jgi:SAM-dependent methyltransferase